MILPESARTHVHRIEGHATQYLIQRRHTGRHSLQRTGAHAAQTRRRGGFAHALRSGESARYGIMHRLIHQEHLRNRRLSEETAAVASVAPGGTLQGGVVQTQHEGAHVLDGIAAVVKRSRRRNPNT